VTSVVVLMGGDSGEREVSLRSGAALCQALADRSVPVVGVDYTGAPERHRDDLRGADVVVPALHGRGGEDGTLQAELERLGVAFAGSGSRASALCMDKWRYKRHVGRHVPVPQGALVRSQELWRHQLTGTPYVVKPNDGGSSLDTHLVPDPGAVDRDHVLDSFTRHPVMLLEELVPGTEITVGVLGGDPLPVVEIVPPPGGTFDYANKYNGRSLELCPPRTVPARIQYRAQELALAVHRLCGCRDLSRTDLVMTPAGDLFVIETNTFPGMTAQSLYPRAAAAAGMDLGDLALRLVTMAQQRRGPGADAAVVPGPVGARRRG